MPRIGPAEAADYARDFLIAAADVETHEAGISNALIGIGWALYARVETELNRRPSFMVLDDRGRPQPHKE